MLRRLESHQALQYHPLLGYEGVKGRDRYVLTDLMTAAEFRMISAAELHRAATMVHAGIARFAEPVDELLARVSPPAETVRLGAWGCVPKEEVGVADSQSCCSVRSPAKCCTTPPARSRWCGRSQATHRSPGAGWR